MFQAAYDSSWHHPGVAWVMAALMLVVALASARPLRAVFALFAVEIALDALFTGPFVPKALAAHASLATAISIAFVILGDYRYFVFAGIAGSPRASQSPLGPAGAWLRAVPFALIVPVASMVVRGLLPATFADDRKQYLLYEAMFFVLALVMRFAVLPRRFGGDGEAKRYALRLTDFEIVTYGLWITADVVILSGAAEPGFFVRIVPNVLYYGAFLLFAWRTAPFALVGDGKTEPERSAAPASGG